MERRAESSFQCRHDVPSSGLHPRLPHYSACKIMFVCLSVCVPTSLFLGLAGQSVKLIHDFYPNILPQASLLALASSMLKISVCWSGRATVVEQQGL